MASPGKQKEELNEDKKEVVKRLSIRQKELEDLEKFANDNDKEQIDRASRHAKVEEIKKRRDKEKDSGKDRDREKHRHKHRDKDREKEKDNNQDNDKEKDKDKEKDEGEETKREKKERHRHRDKDKEREKRKEREKEKEIQNDLKDELPNKEKSIIEREEVMNKVFDDTLSLSIKNEDKNTIDVDEESNEEANILKEKHRDKHKEKKKDKEKSSRHRDKDKHGDKEQEKDINVIEGKTEFHGIQDRSEKGKESERVSEKEGDQEKPREKHRHRDKDKEGEKERDRNKDKHRHRNKDKEKDEDKDNDKTQEKEGDKERDKERNKERDKDKDRNKDKERGKDRDRERNKENERDRDRDKERGREKDKKDIEREIEKDRDKEKERESKDMKDMKEKEKIITKDKEKEKIKERGKERDKDKKEKPKDSKEKEKNQVLGNREVIDGKAKGIESKDISLKKEEKGKDPKTLKEAKEKFTQRKRSVEKTTLNSKSNLSQLMLKETDIKAKEDKQKPLNPPVKAKPRRTNSLEVLKRPTPIGQPVQLAKEDIIISPVKAKKPSKGIASSSGKATEMLIKPKNPPASKVIKPNMQEPSIDKSNFETPTTNKAEPVNELKEIQISPIQKAIQVQDLPTCKTDKIESAGGVLSPTHQSISPSQNESIEATNNNLSNQQDQLEKIFAQQKNITALTQKNQQLENKIDKLKEEYSLKIDKLEAKAEEKKKKFEEIDLSRRELIVKLEEAMAEKDKQAQEITELKEDIELNQEELESKDIEIQLINNKYNNLNADYLKLKATGITSLSSSTQPLEEGEEGESINQKPSAQLEEVLAELTGQLTKVSNERDYMVNYLQEENKKVKEELKAKIEQLKKLDDKDKEIKELKEKAFNYEAMIDNLKEQISELSPANDLYEQIIIEKEELEDKYNEALDQNEKLIEEVNNCNELLNTQEESVKLSEQINKKQHNDIIQHLATIAQLTETITHLEDNEHQLLEKVSNQKKEIETIQSELSLDTNNRDIIQSTLKLKLNYHLLQRKGLSHQIMKIEYESLELNNKLLKEMLPDSISQMGGLHSFEKFFYVWSLRSKIMKLLMNIIQYELIQGNETNEVLKTFYCSVTDNLCYSYHVLTVFAAKLLKVSEGNYNLMNDNEEYTEMFNDIKAIGNIINEGIKLINSNSFGIKYENQCNLLSVLSKKMDNSLQGYFKDNDECYMIIPYLYNIISAYVMLAKEHSQSKEKTPETEKELLQIQKHLERLVKHVSTLILTSTPFPNQALSFESPLYQKLLSKDPCPDINVVSSLCNSALSSIESILNSTKANEKKLPSLPIQSWADLAQKVKKELTLLSNSKEEIDKLKSDLRQSKIQLAQSESDKKEIERLKEYNDKQYGELLYKIGQLPELEQEKKLLEEKCAKQNMTINSLVKTIEEEKKKCKAVKEEFEKLEETSKNSLSSIPNSNKTHKTVFLKSTKDYAKLSSTTAESTIAQPTSIMMNTIHKLQKDKRGLKCNIIKEKIVGLARDNQSYMNQLIHKDQMTQENAEDKETYNIIEDSLREINESYISIRSSFPSVNALDNQVQEPPPKKTFVNMRSDYMNNIKDVILELFGKGSQSSFADILNIEIEKQFNQVCNTSLTTHVASLRLGNEERKDNEPSSKAKTAIFLNESSLNKLNSTFML